MSLLAEYTDFNWSNSVCITVDSMLVYVQNQVKSSQITEIHKMKITGFDYEDNGLKFTS